MLDINGKGLNIGDKVVLEGTVVDFNGEDAIIAFEPVILPDKTVSTTTIGIAANLVAQSDSSLTAITAKV